VKIENGMAKPAPGPGLGIDWDWAAIDGHTALGSLAVLA
jgi:L-alanine-DL-glutamate epimerase-like enolase superfamily enzyme